MLFVERIKTIARSEVYGLYERSRLVKFAKEGSFTQWQLQVYLKNLEYLFKVNVNHIFLATQIHAESNELCSFFQEKWNEENGHDKWARNDLEKLNSSDPSKPPILNSMYSFGKFLEETMRTSPYSYVAYLFLAEYLTSEIGPDWMATITSVLNIDKKAITAISHHVELDGDHANEVLEFLSNFHFNKEEEQAILNFLRELTGMYENFFDEIWAIEYGGFGHEFSRTFTKISSAS